MKILFITISWPETGGNNLYTDLINELKCKGHLVTVLASRPQRTGKSTACDIENDVKILRVSTGNITKTKPVEKILSLILLNYQFKKAIKKYLNDSEFDLLLFNTPPITLVGLLEYLKNKYNCFFYLLLKDLWPYGFSDNNIIKKNGIIYKYFKMQEKRLYELADSIGCMSPRGVEFVHKNYPEINQGKLEVCPNAISVHQNNKSFDSKSIKKKFGVPKDAVIFCISGNLGLGHGLKFLVQMIKALHDYKKAFFLISGSGTQFKTVEKFFLNEKPGNARLFKYLPQDEYEQLTSICDVGMIFLDRKYSYPQFPSRILSYLESKMAILCSVNEATDIGIIVEKYGAGLNTLHGDSESFISAVKMLSENPEQTKEMGENAFQLLKNEYDVKKASEIILKRVDSYS